MTDLRDFEDYVEHPRFGRGPRTTGLNPKEIPLKTFFHWHSPRGVRVDNTAIEADVARQNAPTIGVTHYFDSRRVCRTCSRPFLFFAEEQKYWYETLGF